ncbi:MAG: hypothetical protein IJ083_05675 [Clostridia bacterium]|nr:hypothetical protein [Clostridia bacterium]
MNQIHAEAAHAQPLDPYQELAIAVIKQAAYDYRAIARRLKRTGSSEERQRLSQEKESIRRFFLGQWYELLSGSDNGPVILQLLDREVDGYD